MEYTVFKNKITQLTDLDRKLLHFFKDESYRYQRKLLLIFFCLKTNLIIFK